MRTHHLRLEYFGSNGSMESPAIEKRSIEGTQKGGDLSALSRLNRRQPCCGTEPLIENHQFESINERIRRYESISWILIRQVEFLTSGGYSSGEKGLCNGPIL